MANYNRSDEYTELMYKVIDKHESLHWIKDSVAVDCLGTDKKKTSGGLTTYAECVKVKSEYKPYCPYDFLIIIYEPACVGLSDEQMEILMYHELLHIDVSEKDGEPVYKTRPHDLQDFKELVREYGVDWVN